MRKPTICICEAKGADQLRSYCKADQCLVFATRIVQFPFFLNKKFPASSHLLCLYRPVCVGPGQNYCWFSHEVAPLARNTKMQSLRQAYREPLYFSNTARSD